MSAEPVPPLDERWLPSATDVLADPEAAVAVLARVDPRRAASGLVLVDPRRLAEAGRVDLLTAVRRQVAHWSAVQTRLLAGFAAERARDDLAAMEVAPALLVSQQVATARMSDAACTASRLADTVAAQEAGEITEAHTRALSDAVVGRPDPIAAAVQARVLPRAGRQSVSSFRRSVRRAVLECDRRGSAVRHREARERRRVSFRAVDDGMCELWALLPAEDGLLLRQRLDADAAATAGPDDLRTVDQRRADALVALAVGGPSNGAPLVRTDINVTVPLASLLGTNDAVGELLGHGPISAALCRDLAATVRRWRVLVTDEHGRLVAQVEDRYRPSGALRRLVMLRDERCSFPGCEARAVRCDIDHRRPWPDGPTCPGNLHPLCRRHHRVKHRRSWSSQDRCGPEPEEWTSPTRHRWNDEAGASDRARDTGPSG